MSRHRLGRGSRPRIRSQTSGRSVCRSWSIPWFARDILYEADGVLSLGRRGEKLYGRKELLRAVRGLHCAPCDAGPARQRRDRAHPGHVRGHARLQPGAAVFPARRTRLEVGQSDWTKGVLHVKPADRGRVPTWIGLPDHSRPASARTMLDVLLHEQEEVAWLTRTAALELASLRGSYSGYWSRAAPPWRSSQTASSGTPSPVAQ